MLTISQLATYAGVTVRAVRHYHQIGLLPEPARDRSGYRSYDSGAVVRLIRIHTLADAGVPLARVQELRPAVGGSPGWRSASSWHSRRASWTTWTGCAVTASASATSGWSATRGS